MNSENSLIPAHGQGHVNLSRKVHGVALTYEVARGLSKGQIYFLWVVFGAIVFLNALIQYSASITLQISLEESPNFVTKILQGNHLVYAFAPLLFARLADVYSRHLSSVLALLLFIVGCTISAASSNSATFAVGTVFHTIGMAAVVLLAMVFIADYTPLKWRGAALSWIYLPSLIMSWAGPAFYVGVVWKWTYGMAAIVMLALGAPAVYLLFSAARSQRTTTQSSQPMRLKDIPSQMDLVGLSIFTLGFGLLEYGSTTVVIRGGGPLGKYSPGRITMLVIGLLLVFPIFIYWELYHASFPLMPQRILRRNCMLFPIVITFIFQFSDAFSSGSVGYLLPWEWTTGVIGYYFAASTIAYTASAPLLGMAYYFTRRSKPFLIIGNVLFIVGCGLWLHIARRWDPGQNDEGLFPSKAYPFITQALIGLGTIAIDTSILIGSQASVTRSDLALATALISAWTRVGFTLGTSASVAISLRSDSENIKLITSLGLALGLTILCFLLSFFVPSFVLGDKQNAVEEEYPMERDSREGN